ncbi:MAG: aminotransferase class I/II-fold pyridoxal phosphate-dependent enzyme [Gemmatimonadota bacterium]|nr:MAG: aminotransferase class I/II-fold pyridoxal phosphate-dependent enzyme [Gemmatimonadota bacterium]
MTPSPATPLELTGPEMRTLVDAAMNRIVVHLESLPEQPAFDLDGAAELARSLAEPMPERGVPHDQALDLVFRAAPKSFNTAGPGYLAYIPGGGLFHAALADLVADAVNRYVGVWLAAPGLAQLEANVVRWFSEIVGYPPAARGMLTSGGSLANFSAIVTARRERLPADFLRGTVYASDQVHHSITKAAILAGLPPERVRVVPSDARFRLRLDALETLIAADREAGLEPFLLVTSAGTTNTGAVDDLEGAAAVAERHGLWHHADAAYGGFFALTERGHRVLRGLERADSITLDPHKGLFLPYGTGSLLVRDGAALERSHALEAEYLPPMQEDAEFVDFCQISPELSRPFRGLRVWLPFKLAGAGAFRAQLDEKLDLAHWAHERLREVEGVEIVAEPQLSIVAFRLTRPGLDADGMNRLNRELLERINARRRVYLTGTTVRGAFVLRICVLSFRTHLERMEQGLQDIRRAVEELR